MNRQDPRRAARREALLEALGRPQDHLKVVHVAGTNGKGSVAAMVARGLTLDGRRVGLFTSPDLAGPHERFVLDGRPIASQQLAALEQRLAPAIAAAEAAYPDLEPMGAFERWCALAWVWLAEARVDVAVVEAGIGGRHDATNVFAAPLLTLVTSLGLDHADKLGDTLASVVHDKAGIFRPGVPALTSTRVGLELLRAEGPVEAIAPLLGTPRADGGWEVSLPGGRAHLALAGAHQLGNAALAVAALQRLGVAEARIAQALATVVWPGRMERLADADGSEWLLDGAHNPSAVEALVASWGNPAVVVAGIQAGKDAPAMLPLFGERPLVLLEVPGAAASWEPRELAALARGKAHVAADLTAALAIARALAPRGPRCITGSLYLVGAARTYLSSSRLREGAC